ncbi:alpha/beta hydrolase [Salinithrix halophila]|uniref:Alpha/beta hydrolase n=1 Tax=Salinithrix halophila TaxID=1485204 RepID=A0ABV8JDD2_9BACL
MCNQYQIHEDRFRTRDGLHLYYRIWVPEVVNSAVILIHGAGEHLDIYKHLGNRFARDGHAFLTFDLRGFGRSDGRSGHVTCFDEYVDDVDQLLHFFKQRLGNTRYYLIGHSLGGLIAIRFAQTKPDHVNGIVLSAPSLGLKFDIPHFAIRMIQLIGGVTPSFSVDPYRLMKKAQLFPILRQYVFDVGPMNDPFIASRYSIRWVQELLAHINEAVLQVEKIITPTLCLQGDHDPLIPTDSVRLFFDRLNVKDKELVLLPGAGHRLLHSEASTPAADILMKWLKQWV